MSAANVRQSVDDEEPTRLLALSDGLFAIVLTLLVLDLHSPVTGGALTYADLVTLWPKLFSFVLTFLVGGSYWAAHHADFDSIVGHDQSLLWLNLMFLLSVSLLPFTTGIIGDHANTTGWVLYATNMIAIGLGLAAVWGYANQAGMIRGTVSASYRRVATYRHFVIPIIFLISIPVAFLSSDAVYVPLLIPVAFRVFTRLFGDEPAPGRQPGRGPWLALGYLPLAVFAAWTVWLLVRGEI
ncbi:MAG: DUF1211 domain-containing protein [Chloroflexi bacterium]|nr:DUF1211 domain-containing protein [Chloroflexota bacterium]